MALCDSTNVWVHMGEQGLFALLMLAMCALYRQNCWESDSANLLPPVNQINFPQHLEWHANKMINILHSVPRGPEQHLAE